ncbi:nicotinate-nucleotide--dimethylbenzimidazole phosphoribosyltransferase [Streptomyces sp. NPDC032472]|uniref:nicotinate-nucleotide--dimethylbenzimidazole phosphoribosyltransferase n=1 Tax=Streptomyces sp. NPDC032472 TaxID=3155018 RepID=UPI0033C62231
MTDAGQVPGEGLPDNAGMVDQQGIPAAAPQPGAVPAPAPGGYAFQDLVDNPAEAEDEELLLMPSGHGQGSWSDPQVVPPAPVFPVETSYGDAPYAEYPEAQAAYAEPAYPAPADAPGFPDPAAAEAPYAAGAHEAGGRDSGALDLGGLLAPPPAGAVPPASPIAPVAAGRRPLHMGPPVPDATGGVVRSLADRGPAAPVPPAAAVAGGPVAPTPTPTPTPMPVRHPGPPTTGPEYLDVPRPDAAAAAGAPQQLGEIPPQAGAPWGAQPEPQPGVGVPAEAVAVAGGVPAPGPDAIAVAVPAPGPEAVAVPAPGPDAVAVPAAEAVAVAVAPAEAVAVPVAAVPVAEGAAVPAAEAVAGGEAAVPAPAEAVAVAAAEGVPAQAAAGEQQPQPVPGPEGVPAPEGAVVPEAAPVAAGVAMAAPVAEAAVPAAEAAAAPEAPVAVAPEAPVSAEAPVIPEAPQPEQQSAAAPAPEAVDPATAEAVAPAAAPEAVEAPAAPAEPVAVQAEQAPAEPVAQPQPEPQPAEAVAQPADAAPEPVAAAAAPTEEQAAAPEEAVAAQADDAPEAVPAAAPEDAPADEVPVPSAGEAAPGYADAEREAVLRVMRERRDIRNGFRTDPIPHEVLLRVLEAAHHAPSVGHSQPWDFVVIRSAETRRTMHELAQRQREAYAKSLPKGRAKQFKELKIEAILDTPVNIVVTADPTRGGRHTLGRHTQPQMAPYSSALAVENLWLAARAEGLGVGWVSFFDEREMVRELGLPEHLEVVAYLCVGYVDEFPEEPELMQAGWSQRRPLAWVVHEETYGRRALPGEAPHDLLSETVAGIRPLDAKALGEAWERQKRMTKPAGALGMLEIISAQLAGLSRVCPPPIPEPAAVAIFAGDHGVHAQGVTPWPQEVTTQMVANFLGGGAVCNAFANQVGAEVCVVDVGVKGDLPATPGLLPRKVRPGTDDLSAGPAMSREDAIAAIEVGIETARDLVAAGNKALLTGEMGIANTTVSAALISVFTGVDPSEVTGRGTGINDETHARKVDVVRRALELHQPDPADPIGVLAAIGGLEHAAIVGLILGGASLRTPVILDGVSAGAAALVARAIAPESLSACIAGHRSAEPGHVAALNKLGLRPLVDLDLRLGEGTGALLALPLVQSAARAMHEVATFDSAGVTEK